METQAVQPGQELHLSHLWGPRRIVGSFGRCLIVSTGMSACIGGLAFLADSTQGSNAIMTHEGTYDYARTVAAWSFPPMLFVALQVEFQLLFVLSVRRSWKFCQTAFPLIAGACGGFLGWFLFPQPSHGPKETMLISGAALVLYTGVSVQLAMWSLLPEIRPYVHDFPRAWYSAMVLLAATFFGALHGWTDTHPQLKLLLDYRERQWVEKEHPLLPAPESDDSWSFY